ncbi:MAG: hypothetical protein QXI07_05440 [Pyrobaculum sp.]
MGRYYYGGSGEVYKQRSWGELLAFVSGVAVGAALVYLLMTSGGSYGYYVYQGGVYISIPQYWGKVATICASDAPLEVQGGDWQIAGVYASSQTFYIRRCAPVFARGGSASIAVEVPASLSPR